jgi:hypothetical protein
MDIDFHYYATSIAHAAQYIDDAMPIRQIKTADIETTNAARETAANLGHVWNRQQSTALSQAISESHAERQAFGTRQHQSLSPASLRL